MTRLTDRLRANADLADKAIAFMSDPEQIEEAREDIELWRAAAAEVERLEAAIEEYLLWRPGEAGHAAAHRQLAAALRSGREPS